MLERATLNARSGELTFAAYFEDGFFARFTGVLLADAAEGVLTTADSGCTGRILSTDTVVLQKQRSLTLTNGGPPFRTLITRLLEGGAFQRERPPMEPLMDLEVLRVAPDHWWGAETTALRLSGRFSSEDAALAALDPDRPISADGYTVPLGSILHAADIGPDGAADWIVVAPSAIAVPYRRADRPGGRERAAAQSSPDDRARASRWRYVTGIEG